MFVTAALAAAQASMVWNFFPIQNAEITPNKFGIQAQS